MTNANTEVIEQLDNLAEQRFLIQVQLDEETAQHKSLVAQLEAEHAAVLAVRQAEIKTLDSQIYDLIKANRAQLIAPGKQSFAIMRAKFQFRKSDAKTKIKDAAGVMAVARRLGVVRKIAKISVSWKLNQSQFFGWLAKNGELRSQFEDYLEEMEAGESLTMQPNTNYTVFHDSKRISPPSISIETTS